MKTLLILLILIWPLPASAQSAAGGKGKDLPAEDAKDFSGVKIHQKEVTLPAQSKVEILYSWSLRDADIHDVLLSFAKGSKINIIVDPGVEGKVTVDLNMVSFDKVLNYLLAPLGLEYTREENFIRVFKPRQKTKIFQLDYVNAQRIGKGSLSISAGGGEGGIKSTSSASIENTTTTDFWGTVIDALNTIVFAEKGTVQLGAGGSFSKKDTLGKTLIVNPHSGVILVTDTEDKLQEVEDFIHTIQASIQRQVLIQAKIVEVTLSDDFEMGINWSYVADFPEWSRLSGALTNGAAFAQTLLPSPESKVFQLGVSSQKTSVLLDAMAKQGNVNILSSPQIVTLNNQTAMIKVTQESVYFQVTTSVETDTNTQTQTVESKTIDVGIVLDVTPQISDAGLITLNIHPSISEIVGEAVSKLGDTRPIIDRRETNAVVKVNDGQTIVMAGLMKEKQREDLKKVPCLGDIPFLGAFFRRTVQEKAKVELVVMLTPIVLNESRIDKIQQIKSKQIEDTKQEMHLGLPPLEKAAEREWK
ncbi:MAG: secretin and TonB N-terminal domain-containing protein [Candidatus Schekmanbacteria bacterium]|nr:secretin and TonB N-terminal domain-containing protein [Candidatus Schekmanbacteria bacterium]